MHNISSWCPIFMEAPGFWEETLVLSGQAHLQTLWSLARRFPPFHRISTSWQPLTLLGRTRSASSLALTLRWEAPRSTQLQVPSSQVGLYRDGPCLFFHPRSWSTVAWTVSKSSFARPGHHVTFLPSLWWGEGGHS